MSSAEMLRDTVLRLIMRDLQAMQREIAAYPDDTSLWTVPSGISNSGGTLALHLSGNLRGFIGAMLGGSGYVRHRESEFALRGLSRDVVIAELVDAERQVIGALRALDLATLDADFPIVVMETTMSTGVFLLHLAAHSAYHLGQVDYHRRLSTGDGSTVKTISIPAMVAPLPEVRAV